MSGFNLIIYAKLVIYFETRISGKSIPAVAYNIIPIWAYGRRNICETKVIILFY
jgi:hypothetical protein